MNELDGA